jgi:hypothetical protein
MPVSNKLSWRVGWPLLHTLLAAALLAVWVGYRISSSIPSAEALDGWDIPRLVAYLNGEGLGLRMVATQKESAVCRTAFLTTTSKEWGILNRLYKDPRLIDSWQGTVYCELGPGGNDWIGLTRQWGDYCLVVGPFLLYGDRTLLDRIRVALAHVQAAARFHTPQPDGVPRIQRLSMGASAGGLPTTGDRAKGPDQNGVIDQRPKMVPSPS